MLFGDVEAGLMMIGLVLHSSASVYWVCICYLKTLTRIKLSYRSHHCQFYTAFNTITQLSSES